MGEFDTPQSRNEAILQNMLGADNTLAAPQSRNEKLLLKLLGENVTIEDPQSRIEVLLKEMIDRGFTAFDESDVGKVVTLDDDTYTLASQTPHAKVTENGTYDVSANNSIQVDVASSGSDIVTGTITFAEEQTLASTTAYIITHNLGKAPTGVMWILIDSTSIDSSNRYIGSKRAAGEYMTASMYVNIVTTATSTTSGTNLQCSIKPDSAANVWASLNGNATTLNLFVANGSRSGASIMAGTTIKWFVW